MFLKDKNASFQHASLTGAPEFGNHFDLILTLGTIEEQILSGWKKKTSINWSSAYPFCKGPEENPLDRKAW